MKPMSAEIISNDYLKITTSPKIKLFHTAQNWPKQ